MVKIFCSVFLLSFFYFNIACFARGVSAYNSYVNKAEMAIVSGNLKKASNFYRSAFKTRQRPFGQDLYNALVCNVRSGGLKQIMPLCFKLAEKGAGSNFFEKLSLLQPFHKEREWMVLLNRAALVRDSLNKQNKSLYAQLDSLRNADQKIHNQWARSDHNSNLRNRMEYVDDSLSLELMKIFKARGYLSEFKIGLQVINDTIITSPVFQIIILHNYQGILSPDTLFSPLLRQALLNGEIKPEEVAQTWDNGSGNGNRPFFGTSFLYTQYDCSLYISKDLNNKEDLNKIERARRDIGLYPLADFTTKLIFTINHPKSGFLIPTRGRSVPGFTDENAKANFLKHHEAILRISGCTT